MKLTFFHRGRRRWISHITNLLHVFAGLQSPYLKKNTNKHGVSRKFESLLSRISCPRRKKNDMVFLVGFCFFRMENLALTNARKKMYWERRSTARVHQCCCINAVTFVFKTQFLAHFPFPAKFIIGRIWDRRLAIIRYIGKIWDGREKVKSPIV